jgi:hypothetical protein
LGLQIYTESASDKVDDSLNCGLHCELRTLDVDEYVHNSPNDMECTPTLQGIHISGNHI